MPFRIMNERIWSELSTRITIDRLYIVKPPKQNGNKISKRMIVTITGLLHMVATCKVYDWSDFEEKP